jgi:hypothetical protein
MWGYGPLPHHYEKMHKNDKEYVVARRAGQEATKNASLQSFTPGDAKKGAGLFKVGILVKLDQQYSC